MTRRALRKTVLLSTALALSAAQTGAPVLAQSNPAPLTRVEYEACQTRDESAFKQAIEVVTTRALEAGLAGYNYGAAVREEWRRHDLDQVSAERIDKAIEEIRSETGFTEQISSLFSKDAATNLATMTAERVYRSEAMKVAIEKVATGIARDIGGRLELATADAAEPAMRCLEAFLGPRYGATIAAVVAMDAGREAAGLDSSKGAARVSTPRLLVEGKEAIAGSIILVVRRQLTRLSARIGQRLVGAVVSRVVSVVAGGIGVVLIAKDLWELRHGALPIIATEMKAPATRDKVQDEIARAIGEQVGEHVREIAVASTVRIIEIWHEFRRAHAKVLDIAERNETFRRFVDDVSPSNLGRLDEVAAIVLASEGESALVARARDGTLHRAVERMPVSAMTLARETRSLEAALGWWTLAGDRLDAVVESEIFRRNGPAEFSSKAIERLLGLGDRLAMTRLASLKGTAREPLLELGDAELKTLARALTEDELASLSSYLSRLSQDAGRRLLSVVGVAPARMQQISTVAVRDAIVASRDQSAAVGMMLRGDSIFDFLVFADDVALVRDGRVDWRLLWARYPVWLGSLGFLALFVLAFLWRLLFGRRPRIVVEQVRR